MAPSSANVREYLVDSGAAYHLVCKRDLTLSELKRVERLKNPVYLQTANGIITADCIVNVYVDMLDTTVSAITLALAVDGRNIPMAALQRASVLARLPIRCK